MLPTIISNKSSFSADFLRRTVGSRRNRISSRDNKSHQAQSRIWSQISREAPMFLYIGRKGEPIKKTIRTVSAEKKRDLIANFVTGLLFGINLMAIRSAMINDTSTIDRSIGGQ